MECSTDIGPNKAKISLKLIGANIIDGNFPAVIFYKVGSFAPLHQFYTGVCFSSL